MDKYKNLREKTIIFLYSRRILTFLIILYGLAHVFLVFSLPIMNDEAIYIRWGQRIFFGENLFLPLEAGIAPLFMWLISSMMFFLHDPLIAGRIVSILLGAFALVGIWLLTTELFKNKIITILATMFFIFSPFSIFYEHFVLLDVAVASFGIWSIYFTALFAIHQRLKYSLMSGIFIGLTMLVKSSGSLFIFVLPATILIVKKINKKVLILYIISFVFILIISNLIYSVLKLSPFFERTLWLSGSFVYPKKEWISLSPLFISSLFLENMRHFAVYLFYDIPIAWIPLVFAGIISKKYQIKNITLILSLMIPVTIIALFGKPNSISSRHIYPYSLVLLPLFASSLFYSYETLQKLNIPYLLKKLIIFLCFLALIIQPILLYIDLLSSKRTDLIYHAESALYIDNCGSGTGFNKTIELLRKTTAPTYIATNGIFGLSPQGLQAYLHNKKNIAIDGFLTDEETMIRKMKTIEKKDVYVILGGNPHKKFLPDPRLSVIFEISDIKENCYFGLYKIMKR